MFGQTIDAIRVFGKITKCTELEYLPGLMEESIRVTILMIKNKEGVFSLGQMGGNMMENGIMENSMVKEFIIHQREK